MPFDRVKMHALRESRVLTQSELAELAGVSHLSVHKIETGQQQPRPATIRKLARALRVKPADLLERTDGR
jgi:transcriptional regulator with XRE-family HTH domain